MTTFGQAVCVNALLFHHSQWFEVALLHGCDVRVMETVNDVVLLQDGNDFCGRLKFPAKDSCAGLV